MRKLRVQRWAHLHYIQHANAHSAAAAYRQRKKTGNTVEQLQQIHSALSLIWQ